MVPLGIHVTSRFETYLTIQHCKKITNKLHEDPFGLCAAFYHIHQISIVYRDCQFESVIGDGICDQEANNEDCQYDGGDCCYADCKVCSDGNCNSDASKCIGKTDAGGKLFVM